jgi:hypothetical protein
VLPVLRSVRGSRRRSASVQNTKSDDVALCERLPLTPVTVNVTREKPARDEVTVSVEEEVAGSGENDPVTPAGSPVTLRLTAPVNPLLGVIVTV